jgi:hypothetical protein
MLFNVGLDTVVGSVPIVGDLFDAGWKANVRNIRLLEQSDPDPGEGASWLFVLGAIGALIVVVVGAILFVVLALVDVLINSLSI